MSIVKKYVDYLGLRLYHNLIKKVIDNYTTVIANALNDLDERISSIANLFKDITKGSDGNLYITKNNVTTPISHPDLSNQPSILPQKFGLWTMYEVLCPYVNNDFDTSQIPDDSTIIEGSIFGNGYCEGLNSCWMNINNNRTLVITNIINNFTPEFAVIRYFRRIENTNDSEDSNPTVFWKQESSNTDVLVDKYGKPIVTYQGVILREYNQNEYSTYFSSASSYSDYRDTQIETDAFVTQDYITFVLTIDETVYTITTDGTNNIISITPEIFNYY